MKEDSLKEIESKSKENTKTVQQLEAATIRIKELEQQLMIQKNNKEDEIKEIEEIVDVEKGAKDLSLKRAALKDRSNYLNEKYVDARMSFYQKPVRQQSISTNSNKNSKTQSMKNK